MADFNWAQYEEKPKKTTFDWSKYEEKPEEAEEETKFTELPESQGFFEKLPRDIKIGLANLMQSTANTPFNLTKGLEQRAQQFNKGLNIPGPKVKTKAYPDVSSFIPHTEEMDYAKLLGQEEPPTLADTLIQKGIEYAPEIAGGYGLTKGLIKAAAPKITERIGNIPKYGKLKEKLAGIDEDALLAQKQAEEAGFSASEATERANQMKELGNKQISEHLNEGAAHAARAASSITHRINNIENYWKSGFRDLKTNLKDSEFKMENIPKYTDDMQYVIKNIKDLEIVNGKFVIKGQPEVSAELQSIIDKAPTPKDVAASDFITKYQDFRDARYDLLQRAKDPKASASERKSLFKAYEESKPIEESVTKALNEGLGEHKEEFNRLNKGYSTQVYPIRGNPVAKKALKGKLGPNAMDELAGHGAGQEQMRELVKQDPELLRNIVGQRYASKPEAIHELSETTAEYLYEMPELRKIMEEQQEKVSKELKEVTIHKAKKEISLKQKMKYEKESKELKQKLDQIESDRSKIWKKTKKIGKAGIGLAVGIPTSSYYLGKLFNK